MNGNGDRGVTVRQALGLILVVMALGLVTDPEPNVNPLLAAVILLISGLLLLGIDVVAPGGWSARKHDDRKEDR